MRRISGIVACAVILASCGGDGVATVLIDLKTDYVAGQEFARVRTSLFVGASGPEAAPLAREEQGATFGEDFLGGRRVAELSVVASGAIAIYTELLRADGSVVATRVSRAALAGDGATGITVLISRDCTGVLCPGAGDASATECFGGTCVAPECIEESAGSCGPTTCTTDAECTVTVPCARGRCVAGACLSEGVAARCSSDEYCDPTVGCEPRMMSDAGLDAGTDAVVDAAPDAFDSAPPLGAQGDPCAGPADCESSLACAPYGGVSTCEPTCSTSAECGLGTCREPSSGTTGICTAVCDPVTQTGCPPGQFCHFFISFLLENDDMIPATTCGADVGQAVGSTCGASGGGPCGPGQFCINDTCAEMCRASACPGDLVCRTLVAPFLLRGEDTMWCL